MEYFIILMLVLLFTFFLEKKYRVTLYKTNKQRLLTILIFFLFGTVWDSFAIWRGHWIFPAGKTLGIKIGFMPIEEYLFTLIVPYNVITIYKVVEAKLTAKSKR